MSTKYRVHIVASDLGLSDDDVLKICVELAIPADAPSSSLEEGDVRKIKRTIKGKRMINSGVVIAPKETRLKRLVKTGLLKSEALKRMNAQTSQKDYMDIADLVINNNGTLKQLNAKVQSGFKL